MNNKQKQHEPFRVVCIDNSNKPLGIDDTEWLNKQEEYIVTDVFKHLITNQLCFKLLDKNPHPYKGFTADRFRGGMLHSVN
jgi:hypothetical protein